MAEPVNPRLSLRAERAAVTRRRIAAAARKLFARDGYGATTLQAVADEAGVAVQTVYAVFGSKAGILLELRDLIVFQPEAEALLGVATRAAAAGDMGAAIDSFARSIRVRWEAGVDVVLVHREAGLSDPKLREAATATYERRRGGMRAFAAAITPGLRPGVPTSEAMAMLDVLTLPEVYIELVRELSWTPDTYQAWLAGSLRRLLLDG
jgi:AcrR family transcriptional regulator